MNKFTFNDLLSKKAVDTSDTAGLSDGWHQGRIEVAEVRTTKNGDGRFLKIVIREKTNRKVYCNINLEHPNKAVTQIGSNLLQRLKLATGNLSSEEPSVFIGKEVDFLIKTSRSTGKQQVVFFRSASRNSRGKKGEGNENEKIL
jgi:hypothetical protein